MRRKGEIGADPIYQGKGLGKEAMLKIEKAYPKVKKWWLETPSESIEIHSFYESLGYQKVKERKDKRSEMKAFVYEKIV